MQSEDLGDKSTRATLVQAFNRETEDPNWSELAEDQSYSDYYDWLSNLVQKAAEQLHDPAAWRALVYSNYGEYSQFGRWLAKQPEAFPFCFEMLHSQYEVQRNRALVMAAEALSFCQDQTITSCNYIRSKSDEIKSLVRSKLTFSDDSASALSAVEFIGEQQELVLLRTLEKQDTLAGSTPPWLEAFRSNIRRAEDKIRARLALQAK